METTGIEPATSWLQTRCSSIASENQSRLTTTEPERCTKCCTAPAGDQLAEFVHSLTPEQRTRLLDLFARFSADWCK